MEPVMENLRSLSNDECLLVEGGNPAAPVGALVAAGAGGLALVGGAVAVGFVAGAAYAVLTDDDDGGDKKD